MVNYLKVMKRKGDSVMTTNNEKFAMAKECVEEFAKGFFAGACGGFVSGSMILTGSLVIGKAVPIFIPQVRLAYVAANILAIPLGFASAHVGIMVTERVYDALANASGDEKNQEESPLLPDAFEEPSPA